MKKALLCRLARKNRFGIVSAAARAGDVFGFVVRYENIEFRDAIKILAQKAGVQLPEYRPQNPAGAERKRIAIAHK